MNQPWLGKGNKIVLELTRMKGYRVNIDISI
jgi:hypothetical protein